MTVVRWGIIGCGDVTEVKSGPALQRVEGSELVAVMRRTPGLAEDYARRHGVPRWSEDADDILHADDIDAVYIATHPDTHLDYTIRAAEAGKAVYVEKPVARSAAECRRMLDACDRAGVPLWVAYYRRALPRFRKIRSLIDAGAIGRVRAVSSLRHQRVRADAWQNVPGASGGGYFFDAGCHALDFLQFLFGPMTDVHGLASSHGGIGPLEDTVVASYRFANGVIGSGTWCFDCADEEDVTTIVGADGTLSFSVSGHDAIRVVREGRMQEHWVEDPEHAHQPLVQTIVDELAGRGTCPSTGRTALDTAVAMDAILADVRSR